MTDNEAAKEIPVFKSRQEEAEFWDTHDFTDYSNGFKPVKLRVARSLSRGITIRFDDATLERLRKEAAELGIGPTTLIRMWVLERLRDGGIA